MNFWSDFWLPLRPIRRLIEGSLSFQEAALTVWDVKVLRVAILSLQLPDFFIQTIFATRNAEFQDSSVWAFS